MLISNDWIGFTYASNLVSQKEQNGSRGITCRITHISMDMSYFYKIRNADIYEDNY